MDTEDYWVEYLYFFVVSSHKTTDTLYKFIYRHFKKKVIPGSWDREKQKKIPRDMGIKGVVIRN
jgi:hypothetical protein